MSPKPASRKPSIYDPVEVRVPHDALRFDPSDHYTANVLDKDGEIIDSVDPLVAAWQEGGVWYAKNAFHTYRLADGESVEFVPLYPEETNAKS